MIKLIKRNQKAGEESPAKRDHEIQRIETFSDAVFAFAVTLLIVSLEVPHSFNELLVKMQGFFVFGICFLVLISIWNNQHIFFRRYGMDDFWTVALNAILLFIVLFYVYPLKFLFTLFLGEFGKSHMEIEAHQVPQLMMIYAGGFMVIYLLFFFMYFRALRNAKGLHVTAYQKFECQSSVYKELIMISIGLLSFIAALLLQDDQAGAAGYVYILIGPGINFLYYIRNKKRKKLFPGQTS